MKKHFVAVCTRNRPNELANITRDLLNQSSPVELILIIDSSDSINHVQTDLLLGIDSKIKIYRTEPGLCKQRNKALEILPQSGIVTFFDDDVRLEHDYIACVEQVFAEDAMVCGVGGRTYQTTKLSGWKKLLLRIIRADSNKSGKVLESGVNVPFYDNSSAYKVDWLPGCCMSFKLEVAKNLKFDESRPGVGWGEDVDFSLKVSKFGNLVITPFSPVLHLQSEINRVVPNTQKIRELDSRIKLAIDFEDRVSISVVTLHFIALDICLFLEAYFSSCKTFSEKLMLVIGSPKKIAYILKTVAQTSLSSYRHIKHRHKLIIADRKNA